jgi:hypothetical protein
MAKKKEKKRGHTGTMIYKTLHRKIKFEQHEPNYKPGVNAGVPERKVVPASHVAHVMLLLLQSR